jgi:hypothetical protein
VSIAGRSQALKLAGPQIDRKRIFIIRLIPAIRAAGKLQLVTVYPM